jgi:hypothetical protein
MDITFSGSFHVAVTLLFGAITLGLAVSFAVRPAERKLRILTPMSWATASSIPAAVASGVGATTLNASLVDGAGDPRERTARIMAGPAEALVVPVLGFVLLALSWMLMSLGLRRQD